MYHLAVQNGSLTLRMEALERQLAMASAGGDEQGLAPGTVLNDFDLPILSGGSMTLSQWRGRKVLLIFFSPSCSYCVGMLPELAAELKALPGLEPVIVSSGDAGENRRLFAQHGIEAPVLLQEDSEVASLYQVAGTPMGYVVDENGATAGARLAGSQALLAALRQQTGSSPAVPANGNEWKRSTASSQLIRDGLKTGTLAPAFSLPAPDGGELSLNRYRGRKVLLVFSDPECSPCMDLLPKLERFHREASNTAVLMISRGDVEANRKKSEEHDVTFPVGLQRKWEISREYGMFATPIGYLIDESGVLASDVAVGGDAILKLAYRAEEIEREKLQRVSAE